MEGEVKTGEMMTQLLRGRTAHLQDPGLIPSTLHGGQQQPATPVPGDPCKWYTDTHVDKIPMYIKYDEIKLNEEVA